jgi:hypothetical protein
VASIVDDIPISSSAFHKESILMNEFLEERLRLVRSLAEKADPFTKRRLLELANSYEGRIGMTSKATRQLRQIDLSSLAKSAS